MRLPTAILLVLFAIGCSQPGPKPAEPAAHGSPGHGESEHALHNLHIVHDGLLSGAVPDSVAAFDELASLGVRTIISVDGATPDLAAAEQRGMRYVHIPVTYATITDAQRLELARAIRDLPGPVFIHCHHGRHRGPAAAASAAVALGKISPEGGIEFMKRAGTAPNYKGLYACVAAASVASAGEIEGASAEFPAVRRAEGMVAAMVEVDLAFEHLGDVRAAGWAVPRDHPDLVPAAEAGRLTDNLRLSAEDLKARAKGEGYAKLILEAIERASALEEAIVAGKPAEELEGHFKLVQASCKECHASHRDKIE